VSPTFDWCLLAGDETALPTIERWLEIIPAGAPVRVLAEVADADEHRPLGGRPESAISWIHRDGPASAAPLVDALVGEALPPGRGMIWVGGEAGAMGAARRHLLRERGLPPESVRVTGHWKRTVVAWDHHEPLGD
jgi:NADPH-dependent ferric siderophore reductase